jgi:hypothetical protein
MANYLLSEEIRTNIFSIFANLEVKCSAWQQLQHIANVLGALPLAEAPSKKEDPSKKRGPKPNANKPKAS